MISIGAPAGIRTPNQQIMRRGHKIMVQVQSSWFPLVDRNPQKFMEIPRATAADFQKTTQRVYRSRDLSSSITVMVEGNSLRLETAPR